MKTEGWNKNEGMMLCALISQYVMLALILESRGHRNTYKENQYPCHCTAPLMNHDYNEIRLAKLLKCNVRVSDLVMEPKIV